MNEPLTTKWGTARFDSNGYYTISSAKEGFHKKYLHRLIWEEYHGKIPNNMAIHHIDGDKTNNKIDNLELLSISKHAELHLKNRNNSRTGKTNPRWKSYARITKQGRNNVGKQKYGLFFNGEPCKYSLNPQKLIDWFLQEYPLEIIKTTIPMGG